MFVYIKYDNGNFETVDAERLHHLTNPINLLKKYKLTHENGSDISDVLIIYLEGNACFLLSILHILHKLYIYIFFADSLESLNQKIDSGRVKVPANKLIRVV